MTVSRSREKGRATADAGLVGRNVDVAELQGEIERYLDTVDLFRTLGSEPTWRGQDAWTSQMAQ
jgi:hypothetical protein